MKTSVPTATICYRVHHALVQVDVRPAQPERLSMTQAGEDHEREQSEQPRRP
jgi:hypothetical protein